MLSNMGVVFNPKSGVATKSSTPSTMYVLNPNGGGINCACTFFSWLFLHEKSGLVWRSPILGLFLIHYKLSEIQNRKNWGDLEGTGTFKPPALLGFLQS